MREINGVYDRNKEPKLYWNVEINLSVLLCQHNTSGVPVMDFITSEATNFPIVWKSMNIACKMCMKASYFVTFSMAFGYYSFVVTVRNSSCFYTCLWFCSQGGGMHCKGRACMVGGHTWQERDMHGRGMYMAGGMHGRRDGHCSGRYASYRNAFLFQFTSHYFTFTSVLIARAMFQTYLLMHVGFQVGHGEFLSAFTASVTTWIRWI